MVPFGSKKNGHRATTTWMVVDVGPTSIPDAADGRAKKFLLLSGNFC
jgi:hypothetical protein